MNLLCPFSDHCGCVHSLMLFTACCDDLRPRYIGQGCFEPLHEVVIGQGCFILWGPGESNLTAKLASKAATGTKCLRFSQVFICPFLLLVTSLRFKVNLNSNGSRGYPLPHPQMTGGKSIILCFCITEELFQPEKAQSAYRPWYGGFIVML